MEVEDPIKSYSEWTGIYKASCEKIHFMEMYINLPRDWLFYWQESESLGNQLFFTMANRCVITT